MSLVFITGIPGAGKSAVSQELKSRGCRTYGTDEDQLAGWYDKDTQQPVSMPSRKVWATPEWRERHNWHIDRAKVETLAAEAHADTIFICGTAANEAEVWDLFSKVVYLLIDEATLRYRLSNRTDNPFGKELRELEAILGWLRNAEADYTRFGAKIIDASRPLKQVVDEILSLVYDGNIPPGLKG